MSPFTRPGGENAPAGRLGCALLQRRHLSREPPLMFWTMIAGYKIFGMNELGARVGSAMMGLLAALATYHLGRRLFTAEVGLWAGLILPATFIFTVSARAATVDSALTLATLLAMLCFTFGGIAKLRKPDSPQQPDPEKGQQHLLPRPTSGWCPPSGCFAQKVPVPLSPRAFPITYPALGSPGWDSGPAWEWPCWPRDRSACCCPPPGWACS